MGENTSSNLYFLADKFIHAVDKLDGRYIVCAEKQNLRAGQSLFFTEKRVRCKILKITLMLGKKIEVDEIEDGHKYLIDFDKNIGPVLVGSYLNFVIED